MNQQTHKLETAARPHGGKENKERGQRDDLEGRVLALYATWDQNKKIKSCPDIKSNITMRIPKDFSSFSKM